MNKEIKMYHDINNSSIEEYKRLIPISYRPYRVSINCIGDVINIETHEIRSNTLELFMILTAMTGNLLKLIVLYNHLKEFKKKVPENLTRNEYKKILLEYFTAHEKPINLSSEYIYPFTYCSKHMSNMYRKILKF